MQWVQTRHTERTYEKFLRFKCNGCGTTQEVRFGLEEAGSSLSIPNGWRLGIHEGSHFCSGCEKPKRAALPVL
jgi:hypothetical protein